jgi:predicted dehydrogenase
MKTIGIMANPIDVETWADVVISFEDGTRATVTVHDTGLGGLDTRVTAFLTDGVIKVNMTQNDAVKTFSPEPNASATSAFPTGSRRAPAGTSRAATTTGFAASLRS